MHHAFYKFNHDLFLGYSYCGRFGVNKWYKKLIRLTKVMLRDLNITTINQRTKMKIVNKLRD